MDCDCPLWIYGNTETTHVPRQSTGTNIIAAAEAQRQALLKNGQDQKVHGPRLDDCIERFSASRKEELGEKTAAAYRFQLDRLRAYCATRGVHFMGELGVDVLKDFKVEGLPDSMAATSKAQVTAKIRCFLREAYRRSWTEFALAEKVRPYRATHEQKNLRVVNRKSSPVGLPENIPSWAPSSSPRTALPATHATRPSAVRLAKEAGTDDRRRKATARFSSQFRRLCLAPVRPGE